MQEIVAVAAELFGERGYDAVSLDDVAERLDVTKGSLYYYFSGKDELGSAAIETLGTAWTDRLAELVERLGGPPVARLRALVREQLIVAVRDHPAAPGPVPGARRLAGGPAGGDQGAAPAARPAVPRRRRGGRRGGEFVVVDVDTTLHCLHAAMTQASVWYRGLRGAALDAAVDRLADTLMMLVGQRPGEEAAARPLGRGEPGRRGGVGRQVGAGVLDRADAVREHRALPAQVIDHPERLERAVVTRPQARQQHQRCRGVPAAGSRRRAPARRWRRWTTPATSAG